MSKFQRLQRTFKCVPSPPKMSKSSAEKVVLAFIYSFSMLRCEFLLAVYNLVIGVSSRSEQRNISCYIQRDIDMLVLRWIQVIHHQIYQTYLATFRPFPSPRSVLAVQSLCSRGYILYQVLPFTKCYLEAVFLYPLSSVIQKLYFYILYQVLYRSCVPIYFIKCYLKVVFIYPFPSFIQKLYIYILYQLLSFTKCHPLPSVIQKLYLYCSYILFQVLFFTKCYLEVVFLFLLLSVI